MHDKTMILCAGPGLGFYVPGVMLSRLLNKQGTPADIAVFESLFTGEKSNNIRKAKEKFHNNFSFALMAQNLAKDPSPYLDEEKINALFLEWDSEHVFQFVLLSGFWIPVIERYLQRRGSIEIILCHLDAANSTSWDLFERNDPKFRHVWFCNWERKEINYHLPASPEHDIHFNERDNGLVVHGGGWGMGTYKNKICPLSQLPFDLNIIAYQYDDVIPLDKRHRHLLLDPDWNTWDKDMDGNYGFPPIGLIEEGKCDFSQTNDSHDLHGLIGNSRAIVSKPGAGTLIDSLTYSTPLVYLEPFGEYERKNALLWAHYGLGISYEDWERSKFSESILEEISRNLSEIKARTNNFVNFLTEF